VQKGRVGGVCVGEVVAAGRGVVAVGACGNGRVGVRQVGEGGMEPTEQPIREQAAQGTSRRQVTPVAETHSITERRQAAVGVA